MGLIDKVDCPATGQVHPQLGPPYSLWVFNFGLACCAIEIIAASTSRHDFIRLGVIPFAHGPRQADLLVVAGTLTDKMAPALKRLYEQMPEPKYVISFGSCSQLRRAVLGLLLGDQGRRPDRAGRRLRPRLPAAARGAAGGHHAPPGEIQDESLKERFDASARASRSRSSSAAARSSDRHPGRADDPRRARSAPHRGDRRDRAHTRSRTAQISDPAWRTSGGPRSRRHLKDCGRCHFDFCHVPDRGRLRGRGLRDRRCTSTRSVASTTST